MIHLLQNDSPFHVWFTSSCMIHLFMYDSPLSMYDSPFHAWFTSSCMIHLLHERFTFSCMIYLFMYDSPLHVWFTFSCMIHLNDLPWLWFTFSSMIHLIMHVSPFDVSFTYSCMIHLLLYDSPFHVWFILFMHVSPFDVSFTYSWMIQLLLNDSHFHSLFTFSWMMSPFAFLNWFTFCMNDSPSSCMIHLFMHVSPFDVWFSFSHDFLNDSTFAERFTFSCIIHIFLNDSPFAECLHLFMYDSLLHVWRFTFSCTFHLLMSLSHIPEWFTFCRTFHLFMYDSPLHVWFTILCMIHTLMYDSPFHAWFTFFHEWFTFSWMIHLFHVWFTFSCIFHLLIHIFLNDSHFAEWLTFSFIIHLFHARFTFSCMIHLFMHDSPYSWMIHLLHKDSPFQLWFTVHAELCPWKIHLLMYEVTFSCMTHLLQKVNHHSSMINEKVNLFSEHSPKLWSKMIHLYMNHTCKVNRLAKGESFRNMWIHIEKVCKRWIIHQKVNVQEKMNHMKRWIMFHLLKRCLITWFLNESPFAKGESPFHGICEWFTWRRNVHDDVNYTFSCMIHLLRWIIHGKVNHREEDVWIIDWKGDHTWKGDHLFVYIQNPVTSYIKKIHEKVNHTWKGESFSRRWIIHEKGESCMKRWIIHQSVNHT